jgi:hypothetical protein
MSGYKFTGLGVGTSAGDSVRYEQAMLLAIGTTAGDMVYWTASAVAARLALGAAGGILKVNAGATAPEYLALGTARQGLLTNAGATSPEWGASLQSLMTGTGDIVQSSGANTPARLAIGTARQVPTVNAGATALAYQNPITLAALQTASGNTVFDFGSIPAGVRRIHLATRGLSLSGTDNFLVQIGTGGSPTTSGYISTSNGQDQSGGSDGTSSTAGFVIRDGEAAGIVSGIMTLVLIDSATNAWVASHTFKRSTTTIIIGAGDVALAGTLDILRVTRTGTDTIDAGTVTISYE